MRAAILAALLLAGCSSIANFHPYVQDVKDPAALAADEKDCLGYAQGYTTPLDLQGIGEAGVKGIANNAAEGVLNPLVPVAGGLGGASVALLNNLGVLNGDQRRVFLICLHDRGERSRAYAVIDPN